MTYRMALLIALFQRLIGWLCFLFALISTIISILLFLNKRHTSDDEFYELFKGVFTMLLNEIQQIAPFFNLFWHHSPIPSLGSGYSANNIGFFIIYLIIFIGLAVKASGLAISQQLERVKLHLEDNLLIEEAQGGDNPTRLAEAITHYQETFENLRFPLHPFFLQYYPLYVLPIITTLIGYYIMHFLITLGL